MDLKQHHTDISRYCSDCFNLFIYHLSFTLCLYAVFLQVYPLNQSNVVVRDNATEVSMSCEMSDYLHPDEDLQWFRGGELIISGTESYTIAYTDGRSEMGQFGGSTLGPSRVSTLVISQPQLSDSATYTCAIRNTEHSQEIQLTVESTSRLHITFTSTNI